MPGKGSEEGRKDPSPTSSPGPDHKPYLDRTDTLSHDGVTSKKGPTDDGAAGSTSGIDGHGSASTKLDSGALSTEIRDAPHVEQTGTADGESAGPGRGDITGERSTTTFNTSRANVSSFH